MRNLFWAMIATLLSCSAAQAVTPPSSIYNLEVQLQDQSGALQGLDLYRGRPVLVTMFYGSCPMTCPLLIDTLRTIERSVPPEHRAELRVLLISIDPAHDTPSALRDLAERRHIDGSRWTLASTDDKSVRKIAALLNVQYRALPTGGYNHSSVVTLLDPTGEIVAQSSVLGRADEAMLDAIRGSIPSTRVTSR
jgi:protein SCO1/2